jgi:hypothetical protein
MTMYCFIEGLEPIAGPATNPIEQKKRANEEWKNSIQRVADGMGMPVDCTKDGPAEHSGQDTDQGAGE